MNNTLTKSPQMKKTIDRLLEAGVPLAKITNQDIIDGLRMQFKKRVSYQIASAGFIWYKETHIPKKYQNKKV